MHARVVGFGGCEDQHVVEQRAVALADVGKSIDEGRERVHRAAVEPERHGLIAQRLVGRFFVRQQVMRVGLSGATHVREVVAEHHVEYFGLVAGHGHRHHLRHDLVVGNHGFHLEALRHVLLGAITPRCRRNRTGLVGLGLAQLSLELPFELTDRGEVLVQSLPIRGSDPAQQRLAFVGHRRQHAAPHHHPGVGLEVGLVRVGKLDAEHARIQPLRRGFRSRTAVGAARAVVLACDTAGRGIDGLEARTAGNVVGHQQIERGSRNLAVG